MERVPPRPTNRAALPHLLSYAQTPALERHLSRAKQDADAGAGSGSAVPCALAHIPGTTGCASSRSAIARQPQARPVGLLHQHAWYWFSAAGRGDTTARCREAFGGRRIRWSADGREGGSGSSVGVAGAAAAEAADHLGELLGVLLDQFG